MQQSVIPKSKRAHILPAETGSGAGFLIAVAAGVAGVLLGLTWLVYTLAT